jgi:hypothetical protein
MTTKISYRYCEDRPSCKDQLYQRILSERPTQFQVPVTEPVIPKASDFFNFALALALACVSSWAGSRANKL